MAAAGGKVAVRVWDRPTRLFHWALVIALAGSWYTAENHMRDWHERCGLLVLALIGFRLVWGVVGGRYARFSSFVAGPLAAFRYLRETLAGRHPVHAGHNPLGGWSVLALLAAVTAQAVLGLFANDDIFYDGPLVPLVGHATSGWLTGWHVRVFDLVLALAAIHIVAVLAYAVLLRVELIGPMITGRKWLPAGSAPERVARTPAWIAAVLFVGCAVAAWAITLVG